MPIKIVGRKTPCSFCGAVADRRWSSSISRAGARAGLGFGRGALGVGTTVTLLAGVAAGIGVRYTSCDVRGLLGQGVGSDTAPFSAPVGVVESGSGRSGKARMNAVQLGNRSSGLLASARATTGRSHSGNIDRSGGSVMC
jgi:hypothetical protein